MPLREPPGIGEVWWQRITIQGLIQECLQLRAKFGSQRDIITIGTWPPLLTDRDRNVVTVGEVPMLVVQDALAAEHDHGDHGYPRFQCHPHGTGFAVLDLE